jgi:hypothetical protein
MFATGKLGYGPPAARGVSSTGGRRMDTGTIEPAGTGAAAATGTMDHPAPTTTERPSRIGWTIFLVILAAVAVVVLFSMEKGLPEGSRLANPSPGNAPYPFSPMAKAVPASIVMSSLVLGLFGVLGWLSWKQRHMHWALIIAVGTLFTGLVDPIANWATFASLNPETPHLPTTWAWFRNAPLGEPALSLLGGYSAYYVLSGLLLYWIVTRLVLRRVSPTSWIGRHPLLSLFVGAWVVCLPLNALLQWQWMQAGTLVYTQFFGPVLHLGHVQLPFLILLYDPFVFATIALLCYHDEQNRSVVLTKLAPLLPGRHGHRHATSGRQVVVAGLLVVTSMLLPVGVFSVIRVSGLADKPTYAKYPYPIAKVYDPYGDLQRAGKPGPFVP